MPLYAPDGSLAVTIATDGRRGLYAPDGSYRVTVVGGSTGGGGSTNWNDILGKPTTFPPTSHTHDASEIVSGQLPDARIQNLDASKLFGTIDPDLIPVLPGNDFVISPGLLGDLTTELQDEVNEGTIVVTTDGARYLYKGVGDKLEETSYILLADDLTTWGNISGKPTTFPPTAHTHTPSEIVMSGPGVVGTTTAGFATILSVSVDADPSSVALRTSTGTLVGAEPTEDYELATKGYVDGLLAPEITWDDIQDKPTEFPPSAHTHDAADIISGQLPDARIESLNAAKLFGEIPLEALPVLPGGDYLVVNNIPGMTTGEQDEVVEGTIVIEADGQRWLYKGTGSKVDTDNYVLLADLSTTWESIADKPTTFAPASHQHPISDLILPSSGVIGQFGSEGPSMLPISSVSAVPGSVVRRDGTGNSPFSEPTSSNHAATKNYVDNLVASSGGLGDAPTGGQVYGRQSGAWVALGQGITGTPEVSAYLSSAGVTVNDSVQYLALDKMVHDLKKTGLWSKLTNLRILNTNNLLLSRRDLKVPSYTFLQPAGTTVPSLVENEYTKANGGYYVGNANSNPVISIPTSGIGHHGYWTPSSSESYPEIFYGPNTSGGGTGLHARRSSATLTTFGHNGNNQYSIAAGGSGHYVFNRSSSSAMQAYHNSRAQIITGTQTLQATISNSAAHMFGGTNLGSSDARLSIVHSGESLNGGEVSTLYSIFREYQRAVTSPITQTVRSLSDVSGSPTNGQTLIFNSATNMFDFGSTSSASYETEIGPWLAALPDARPKQEFIDDVNEILYFLRVYMATPGLLQSLYVASNTGANSSINVLNPAQTLSTTSISFRPYVGFTNNGTGGLTHTLGTPIPTNTPYSTFCGISRAANGATSRSLMRHRNNSTLLRDLTTTNTTVAAGSQSVTQISNEGLFVLAWESATQYIHRDYKKLSATETTYWPTSDLLKPNSVSSTANASAVTHIDYIYQNNTYNTVNICGHMSGASVYNFRLYEVLHRFCEKYRQSL